MIEERRSHGSEKEERGHMTERRRRGHMIEGRKRGGHMTSFTKMSLNWVAPCDPI